MFHLERIPDGCNYHVRTCKGNVRTCTGNVRTCTGNVRMHSTTALVHMCVFCTESHSTNLGSQTRDYVTTYYNTRTLKMLALINTGPAISVVSNRVAEFDLVICSDTMATMRPNNFDHSFFVARSLILV